jgi:hypothetical protein
MQEAATLVYALTLTGAVAAVPFLQWAQGHWVLVVSFSLFLLWVFCTSLVGLAGLAAFLHGLMWLRSGQERVT